jgi:hypothetical protein
MTGADKRFCPHAPALAFGDLSSPSDPHGGARDRRCRALLN